MNVSMVSPQLSVPASLQPSFASNTILDAGYFFAPYIPLTDTITPQERAKIRREIKEKMRVPANIIKNAMKQAGYDSRDFEITISDNSETITITTCPGRRFNVKGTCQIHCNKGKMNIFWTYDPGMNGKAHKEVNIVLANPDSLKKISDTILEAVKECLVVPNPYISKPLDPSLYGKVTI